MDRREFLRASGGAIGAGALSLASGTAQGIPSSARRPNILYLMADQFRGDCLGCDGNRVVRTPNLDRIARQGARFSSGYSSTPTCTPARSALLTGLSPWHHGMIGYGRVSNRYPFKLPQALRDAGYYTFGIGKMHWHPQKTLNGFHGTLVDESGRRETPDFVSDYHLWFEKQAPGKDPNVTGIGWNDHRARVYALPEELHPTHWTGQMAVDFIEKYDRSEPFLLKVSFARPHSPYDPPKRFMEMYREDDMPAPRIGKWADRYAPVDQPLNNSLWHGDLGLEQTRRSRRGYYGSVSFIDEQIGRILAAIEKRGMLENTFIIFTADHGDMTGDHHLWRKSYAYEASARIPYLTRWPKGMGMDDRRGQSIAQPVELRDILPTFLEVARAKAPSHLDGKSWLPLLRGQTSGWRDWIDLEHDVCYSPKNHWNALTDGKQKYVFHAFDGREQLFDLRNDPGEINDLASEAKHAESLKTWRQRMVEHFAERGEPFVRNGKLLERPRRILYSPHYPGAPKVKPRPRGKKQA
ncbi:MAG: arylsulfatase [Phycisphaerae bacterium]|nr:arylsulfatase [Phycisphaerae bacterium]